MIKELIHKYRAKKFVEREMQYAIDKLSDELAVEIIHQERKVEVEDGIFVRHIGHELNPNYISQKDYADIRALSIFLRRKHESGETVSQEQLDKIIKKGYEFVFLRKVNKVVPNMAEEILDHGPSYAGVEYAKYMKLKDELKTRKL